MSKFGFTTRLLAKQMEGVGGLSKLLPGCESTLENETIAYGKSEKERNGEVLLFWLDNMIKQKRKRRNLHTLHFLSRWQELTLGIINYLKFCYLNGHAR